MGGASCVCEGEGGAQGTRSAPPPPPHTRNTQPFHAPPPPPTHAQESGLSPYEALYSDDARRRAALEAKAAAPPEGATFHPRINTSTSLHRLLGGGEEGEREGGGGEEGEGEDVAERCAGGWGGWVGVRGGWVVSAECVCVW